MSIKSFKLESFQVAMMIDCDRRSRSFSCMLNTVVYHTNTIPKVAGQIAVVYSVLWLLSCAAIWRGTLERIWRGSVESICRGILESMPGFLIMMAWLLLLSMPSFSVIVSVFAWCRVLLLYCWRVFSFRFFFCWVTGCLASCLTGWVNCWVTSCSVGWLANWLTSRVIACLTGWLAGNELRYLSSAWSNTIWKT